MSRLSEELEGGLEEAGRTNDMTKDSEETMDGVQVVYFVSAPDGYGDKRWAFTMNGQDVRVRDQLKFKFQAQAAAKKAVKNFLAQRDETNGQYKHHGGWERVCKCGHPLGKHSAVSLGGLRDCFQCEEEGKPNAHHKFVAVKMPKKEQAP